jgi:hypothetical protein
MTPKEAMQISIRLNRIGEQLRDEEYYYDDILIEIAVKHLEDLVQHCKKKKRTYFNDEEFNVNM